MRDEGYYQIQGIFVRTAQWLWLLFGIATIGGMIRSGTFDRNVLTAARVPPLVLLLLAALAMYTIFGRLQAVLHFNYQNKLLDTKKPRFVFMFGALMWAGSGMLWGVLGSFGVRYIFFCFGTTGIEALAAVNYGMVGGIVFGFGTSILAWKRVHKALHGS